MKWLRKKKVRTAVFCGILAALMFSAVNLPAAVGVASTNRQLPIYCVQRDQKMVSLSFDAAWGNVGARHPLGRNGFIATQAPTSITSRKPILPYTGTFSDIIRSLFYSSEKPKYADKKDLKSFDFRSFLWR